MAESKVIYTAIMGNYDTLKDPAVITPGWDYVAFTDNKYLRSDVWDIYHIDSSELGPARTARRVKIMMHEYLEYDRSIWIDGNFGIKCNLDDFLAAFEFTDFTLMTHGRDCLYLEATACIVGKKDDENIINAQMERYRNYGFPKNFGLIATGLIHRTAPKNENIIFAKRWWKELENGSVRDQLSFNYVQWKLPTAFNLIDFKTVTRKYFDWGRHQKKK